MGNNYQRIEKTVSFLHSLSIDETTSIATFHIYINIYVYIYICHRGVFNIYFILYIVRLICNACIINKTHTINYAMLCTCPTAPSHMMNVPHITTLSCHTCPIKPLHRVKHVPLHRAIVPQLPSNTTWSCHTCPITPIARVTDTTSAITAFVETTENVTATSASRVLLAHNTVSLKPSLNCKHHCSSHCISVDMGHRGHVLKRYTFLDITPTFYDSAFGRARNSATEEYPNRFR